MFQDVAYAFRTMRKNPGLTAVAVITLALGIGANTAMFSVVNALLLRPLPYRDPGRLVTMRAQIPSRNIKGAFMEYNFYGEWWRGHARSLEAIAAFTPGSATLMTANEPERIALHRVNAGLLGMFGVTPLFGRDFRPEEDQPGASPVALVSHRLWKRKFGGDSGLVGRQIPLGSKSYTVVGILPADFDLFGTENDLLTPIAASTARAESE